MNIPNCKVKFPIRLEELFELHIKPALPSYKNMKYWHQLLIEYSQKEDAVLPIRKGKIDGKEIRGKIIIGIVSGSKMLCADNAPAWAMLYYAFMGYNPSIREWEDNIRLGKLPCHLFNIKRILGSDHHNAKGWHIAHIESINDRSDPHLWPKEEVRRKSLLFIHPLNYFPFPKSVWREFGDHSTVLSYINKQLNTTYSDIRKEYLTYIKSTDPFLVNDSITEKERNFTVSSFTESATLKSYKSVAIEPIDVKEKSDYRSINIKTQPSKFRLKSGREGICWKSTRLYFKRKGIEQLKDDSDIILIKIAPDTDLGPYKPGLVIMTRGQFYSEFSTLIKTRSYKDKGIYHYPEPPKKMKPHFIPD